MEAGYGELGSQAPLPHLVVRFIGTTAVRKVEVLGASARREMGS